MKAKKINYASIISTLFCAGLGTIFSIIILIAVIEHYSFNEAYFQKQFEKNNISAITGIPNAHLEKIIRQITGYLSGRESSFQIRLPIDGKDTAIFNDRELAHMFDVKVIYILLTKIKTGGILLLSLFFMPYTLFVYLRSRQHRNAKTAALLRHYWMNLYKILVFNATFTLTFIAALGFMLFSDFSKYFILFHKIFFDNDLWLLNPQTDRLIQMLPEVFFYDISFQMLRTYTLFSLVLGIIGVVFFYILKRDDTSI